MFSTYYWPISLICAMLGAVFATVLASGPVVAPFRGSRSRYRNEDAAEQSTYSPIPAGIGAFVLVLPLVRLIMYYGQPTFIGALGGYWLPACLTLIPACVCAMFARVGRGATTRIVVGMLLSAGALFVEPTIQYLCFAWGPYNMQQFAALPKIEVMSEGDKIPPTDPDHMVLVTECNAKFKGQSVLNELGSKYRIDETLYTLQAIKGHRYWAAPLTLVNLGDCLNLTNPSCPGFVLVDAENHEVDAQLKLGYDFKLFDDQWWNLYLERYVYAAGWSGGILGHVKFEIDDEGNPHYVYGYLKRPFADGMSGYVLDKVIVVTVGKGEPTIKSFNPNDPSERASFAWVDRAMSSGLVDKYASDWGYYGSHPFAKEHPWAVWFGYDQTGTLKPADLELNYTIGDECVWVVPMTSMREDNHSVAGVLVYETNRNQGKYYPGLKGFNNPEAVKATMESVQANVNHYGVAQIQLVSIFGELTWVGIYNAPQHIGKSFGAIGFLHAFAQNASDVVYATDKESALSLYRAQIGQRGNMGTGHITQTAQNSAKLTARIARIGVLPTSTVGAKLMFAFRVEGNSHTFLITRDVYNDIMLIKQGDEVTFTFSDTKSHEAAAISFACPALDGLNAEAPK